MNAFMLSFFGIIISIVKNIAYYIFFLNFYLFLKKKNFPEMSSDLMNYSSVISANCIWKNLSILTIKFRQTFSVWKKFFSENNINNFKDGSRFNLFLKF